ncbi:hypothetical protein SAMN05216550_10446 [Paraburkholderia tropica]|uniref:Uncharacterized protein n=1 Tax=Paraburkholderia tropica TaxID=92647 RepID=A0AAQ1JT17_9BURK|nr:hypothetical protein SAMN05216550_10446 [Paraburkholderia tropica]
MLKITAELLPSGSSAGRRTVGTVEIVNIGGDAAYVSYAIRV